MHQNSVFTLLLLIAAAAATPVPNIPTQIVRRAPPSPSAYPLDTACKHEWQYLNFNKDDATDKAHLQKLHDVICSGELRALSSYGEKSAEDALAPYLRYFAKSDDEDDFQKHVKDVLGLIAGSSSTDGAIGEIVGTFVVDNLDFAKNYDEEDDCSTGGTLAYTLNDSKLDKREKIHFCDIAWTRGSAANVDCKSLDPYPSTKMDAFSRIALHEMTHYSTVGPKTSLADQIKDRVNQDDVPAYDPPRVHGLIDPKQDDDPVATELNADSYAWMSLDAWISRKCASDPSGNNWATFFKQNPPNYK